MKKLILFSVLMVCALFAYAQTSKLSHEVAMGDQQYLMGNVKEAQKAYNQASRSNDLNVKLLASYRNLELSALQSHPHYKAQAEFAIKKCLKKMGNPNMTQNEFYSKYNILPLHQLSSQTNNTQVVVVQQNNGQTSEEYMLQNSQQQV